VLLCLRVVRKSYGSNELAWGVDLELTAGNALACSDRTARAKTTILRLALGPTEPDAGEISWRLPI